MHLKSALCTIDVEQLLNGFINFDLNIHVSHDHLSAELLKKI